MMMIDQLNALAARIPRAAFRAQGALNCVTYVIVYDGEVMYAGEGLPKRATLRLNVRGINSPDLDDFIAMFYDDIEFYCAAANITKAVAVEFENVLISEFKPPFNQKSPMSIWATLPEGPDTFNAMKSAEKIDLSLFLTKPPRDTHVAQWKRCREDEIPLDWIITRIGLRQKNKPSEQTHYDSYPPLGGTTTVAEHRRRNEELGRKWEGFDGGIKSILHWDCLYPDLITITPPADTCMRGAVRSVASCPPSPS
jgi:hypothetical protein